MNEPAPVKSEPDHTRAVIIASTVVILTCILSCAAVLIVLIMRMS